MKRFKDAEVPKELNTAGESENTTQQLPSEQERVSSVISPEAIRPVGTLHLTLGVMSLDRNKLPRAIECLNSIDVYSLLRNAAEAPPAECLASDFTAPSTLDDPITSPTGDRSSKPIEINLKGLVSMHAPHNTSVLYGAPEDTTARLYPFCLALHKIFKDAGFLQEQNRELKLHATVVNTTYVKGKKPPKKGSFKKQASESSGQQSGSSASAGQEQVGGQSSGHGADAKGPPKIDATTILEKYTDFVWAENLVLDRVAICQMGAKKVMNSAGNVVDEEYTEVATIALPTSQDVVMSGSEQS